MIYALFKLNEGINVQNYETIQKQRPTTRFFSQQLFALTPVCSMLRKMQNVAKLLVSRHNGFLKRPAC